MSRTVEINGIIVRAGNHNDCAHACRYCPIGRKQSPVPLARFGALVRRIMDWEAAQASGRPVHPSLGYHHDLSRADLEFMRDLTGGPSRGITLGGLPDRSTDQLREWLRLRLEFGLETVHATFAGCGPVHDRWNNKPGNYDLLERTLRVGGELGLRLGQRILLSRSTLGSVDELLDRLDSLPKREGGWCYASPFFYQTVAQGAQPYVESDRFDERERDALPERIAALLGSGFINRSEREWIEERHDAEAPVHQVSLVLHVSAANLDQLEAREAPDIVDELERQARRAYDAIPDFFELRARYGDPSNARVYALARCIEMKWLDRFRMENPAVVIDQRATNFWFGA